MVISDHPLSPSGVGTQTKYMVEALLKTGRYRFICLGGAVKHADYAPQSVDPYGNDFRIFPIDGYGTHELIRSVLQKERPDVLWFMTDPRFYGWLWEIENEVRANMPMVYYHVWDNFPAPKFNRRFNRSTDEVVCISKVTHEILKQVAPNVSSHYLPHAVDDNVFKKLPVSDPRISSLREQIFSHGEEDLRSKNKKIFFWNNRNARRKQPGTLIWWFKEWLDKVGHDKACLLMHTDAEDPHGQPLPHFIEHLGLDRGQVLLSTNKVSPEELAAFYNAVDYTINIADAEGFGLGTLESLSCGTPIIVNMTGGLQEQVTDGENWFGWGLEPTSKSIIGSLQVPYIYEDRVNQGDFDRALTQALKLSKPRYKKMSQAGRKYVKENYNFENYEKRWVDLMDQVVEKYGSWENRKGYERYHLVEVA